MNASQIRVARPTDQLDRVIDFYERGLELKRIGEFQGHAGYDGVMYGLPDTSYHLEFTQHMDGSPCPAPTKDNLLVFYVRDQVEIRDVAARLHKMGYPEVKPENPYWEEQGITIEDPDGWRVVLMNTEGLE
ncbi:VOC family protein [Alkalicoccobacillus murimartini]|uniref:Catechol 2,3-dioxygenase-like lactoylglutathione lyase family enzyme n=1 Tax=Alkalicoccobacillus murimartini TaxID=171685 RepID=A0ABT9YJD2_9BACI|nr:VOC family protein [Alkalicoccobacillus murimartini]MDQ0207631.1 catechol 2,3-dioxygenase-like lactoylglutathione lyase family enzyme [Alkalicoccobacillus murimartini]